MSPADQSAIDQHRDHVQRLSMPGGPLSSGNARSTVLNPDYFRRGVDGVLQPRIGRLKLHNQLLSEHIAQHPDVVNERRAIVLAGPPGAGKSTVLTEILGADRDKWLPIDADDFKRSILESAIADGSYESVIKPPEIITLEAAGERFFPLEMASLVHEESSFLAQQLRKESLGLGRNVVIDTVLSSPEGAVTLGTQLKAAGYTVEVIDVEVPFELSAARIEKRWEESYVKALKGEDLHGGRWVPSEWARGVYDTDGARSRPEIAAAQLAETCTSTMRYRRFYTPAEGAPRELEVDKARTAVGRTLLDTAVLQRMTSPSQALGGIRPPANGSGLYTAPHLPDINNHENRQGPTR